LSRVVSEASIVAPHHQAARKRAPAAEAKQPSSPFSSLLDSEAPPPARDNSDFQPQPAKRAVSESAGEARPDKSVANNNNSSNSTERNAAAQDTSTAGAQTDAKPAGDAETVDGCKDAEKAEAVQLLAADLLPAATTESSQQPVGTPQPEAAAVTPPVVALAVAVTAPEPATDVAETATIANVAAVVESNPSTDMAATTAAVSVDSAATDKPKPVLDGKSTPQTQPSGKTDAATPSDVAVGQVHDQDLTQTDTSPEQKPARTERHAAQPGPADGTAQKPADAPHRPQVDAQPTAAVDAAKPAVDGAPQFANVPHPAAHVGAATPAAPLAHAGSATADAADAPVPIAGLAVEIAARVQSGRNRFEIRLDPPDLGRIDVRLDVDRGGNVTSRLVVEKAETLDLLRRDAPQLERALNDAGLKTGDNGLQFTLRDQSFAGRHDERAAQPMARVIVPDAELAPIEAVQAGYDRLPRPGGGIDIQV
jgi:chemotaxis protein MotD